MLRRANEYHKSRSADHDDRKEIDHVRIFRNTGHRTDQANWRQKRPLDCAHQPWPRPADIHSDVGAPGSDGCSVCGGIRFRCLHTHAASGRTGCAHQAASQRGHHMPAGAGRTTTWQGSDNRAVTMDRTIGATGPDLDHTGPGVVLETRPRSFLFFRQPQRKSRSQAPHRPATHSGVGKSGVFAGGRAHSSILGSPPMRHACFLATDSCCETTLVIEHP